MSDRAKAGKTGVPKEVAPAADPAAPAGRPYRQWLLHFVAPVLLLAAYAVLSLSAVAGKSNAFDETAHLAAGYTYWKLNIYRLHPENGNLPQRWGAIGLLPGEYRLPPTEGPAWKESRAFEYGRKFMFEEGNDARGMLRRARAMMLLMGIACGAMVWFWSLRLFGPIGALISLGLFAFCPTVLAHGPMVTSDMTAALFFLLTAGAIWRLMHRIGWGTLAMCIAAASGLALAKFSAPLAMPLAGIMLFIRLLSGRPLEVDLWRRWTITARWGQAVWITGALAAAGIVVLALIWAAYGLRFGASYEADYLAGSQHLAESWATLLEGDSPVTRAVAIALRLRLLPEAYLYGLAHTLRYAEVRQAFMAGMFSMEGWRWFFPYTVLVKTPLTVFVFLLLAARAAGRRLRDETRSGRRARVLLFDGLYATTPLWALLLVYWSAAILTNLNIGHRHVLVTYPIMYILAGAAAWLVAENRRLSSALLGLLLMLHAAVGVRAWPDYLAFFNTLAGGSSQGYRSLVDSSLDWGQDLPGLARWLQDHNAVPERQPAFLAYFGTADPAYWNVEAQLLVPDPYRREAPPFDYYAPLAPGIYAISATYLQSVYLPLPGPWTPAYENTYRVLQQMNAEHLANATDPDLWTRLEQKYGNDAALTYLRGFPGIRTARLAAWLRGRAPIDHVGHSILIFRLTEQELRQALDGPPQYGY